MGKHVHILLSKNESDKTAICKQCGPTTIKLKVTTWRCVNSIRTHCLRTRRLDGFREILAQKNKFCQICGSEKNIVIDHCHDTNIIRGLLCSRCNTGIGKMLHSEELLLKAIEYLRRG